MNTQTTMKTRVKADEKVTIDVAAKAFSLGLGALSGVIGLWSIAALVSGLVAAGGPLGLARSWFLAVTGM